VTTSEVADRRPDHVTAYDTDSDHRWFWRVLAVVVVFAILTVARSIQIGIPLRDPHGSIFLSRISISLAMLLVYAATDAALRARRQGLSLRRTGGVLRCRWTRTRVTLALAGLLAYHVTYFCYHNLKSWDVYNRPRDTMLLEWDRWLFLGHSPSVLVHDLLGNHYAAYALMFVYESFSTMVILVIAAPLAFVDRIRDAWVAIASGVWVWILGTVSYYAIPSLGPFWSAPKEFARLPHTMIQDTQARYLAQRADLLVNPQHGDAFAQISAFASLHVAVTAVILLLARYYGLRRISQALTVFLAGTIVATVYLGWHFFVDDIAGLAIAYASVWLGRRMVHPGGGPARSG
jgi:membrane-associated phospholipid phosphatase